MGDLLGSPRVAPLPFSSDFFLLALSFASVPQARFAHNPFFFFRFFCFRAYRSRRSSMPGLKANSAPGQKYEPLNSFLALKRRGDLEIRESAPGLLLSGVEVHRCITDHL